MKRLLLVTAILLAACSNIGEEYSHRPCFVVIDNSVHQDATLGAAMNALSPGVFCMIRKELSGGAQHFRFTTNTGLSTVSAFNIYDQRRSLIFGLNNGIIVGYGNLDSPAVFYAYDRECPNCFDPDAVPVRSRPLTMTDNGHAICAVCHRDYDLNNRGVCDDGEKLTRFPASTTGPFGNLVVQ